MKMKILKNSNTIELLIKGEFEFEFEDKIYSGDFQWNRIRKDFDFVEENRGVAEHCDCYEELKKQLRIALCVLSEVNN